ncbi:sulfatase [Parapedobacter sp. 2B3]|uniref:sulfatase family protein n=1 Tax=Parapedobacter sp. 2B3 TaxID=3342381 RepID=UPI0035B5FA1A
MNTKAMRQRTICILLPLIPLVFLNSNKSVSEPIGPQSRPNIIYVFADQWRAQATGYAGDPNVQTPNIDALAAKSVNFANAVSVMPICTPYRAALLTGRYPANTGMFLNDLYLPAAELTMAEIYKEAGYETAYIGKWHLDGHGRSSYIPKERRQGFDFWMGNECSHEYYQSIYYAGEDTTARYWDDYDVFAQTKAAEAYINGRSASDNPFILVLSYGPPHTPRHEVPERYKAMYPVESIKLSPNVPERMAKRVREEAAGYYANCTAIDSCIGALQRTIKAAGIHENTIFVFTSDHGEMLGSHGAGSGTKQRPWEESIRVPFLLSYPARLGVEGKEINVPINTPDILPTLLGLAGVDKPQVLEGDDLSDLITGEQVMDDRAALIMNMAPFADYKDGHEYRGIRTARYTYVRNLEGPWMLYDNQQDPYQLNNLVNTPGKKGLQERLDRELNKLLRATGDELLPRAHYIEKWGYTVSPRNGAIPYEGESHRVQSPTGIE